MQEPSHPSPAIRRKLEFSPDCAAGLQNVLAGEYNLEIFPPPRTVLDIGANQGAFTEWARRKWPECLVTACEPMPENCEYFKKNHAHDGNVNLIQAAITGSEYSSLDNFLKMKRGKNNLGECSVYDLGEQSDQVEEVRYFVAAGLPSAEFIKIDTEGCELEILKGLHLRSAKAVVCEYHRAEDVDAIMALCRQAGLEPVTHHQRQLERGILKFRRPTANPVVETKNLPSTPIPDDLLLTGRTLDGVVVTAPAWSVRQQYYRPELRKRKLFIALPVYQKLDVQFMERLLAFQARKPCEVEMHFAQGDGIARCRNRLTEQFLKSDCTEMLFLDCDLIWSPDHVARLMGHQVPVVGGFYPKKQQGPLEWVINPLPGNPGPDENGLQPVKYAGTGFLLVQRAVFEQMRARFPESRFREDYPPYGEAFEYWPMRPYGPGTADGRLERVRLVLRHCGEDFEHVSVEALAHIINGPVNDESRYLSEDWFFCQRWLDMGGTVYCDNRVILRHVGQAVYPLDTQIEEINSPKPRAVEKAAEKSDAV